MSSISLAAITTPNPTAFQAMCRQIAQYCFTYAPRLARPDTKHVYATLIAYTRLHCADEMPFDPSERKSIGIAVGCICDIWAYLIDGGKL